MEKGVYCYPFYVFDDYEEYVAFLSDEARLREFLEKIMDDYYDYGLLTECEDYFRYYAIICYDCSREAKKKSDDSICVRNPVAECTVLEAFSRDEENIDKIEVIAKYREPPGRGWLVLTDIAQRSIARIYNRLYVLKNKAICW